MKVTYIIVLLAVVMGYGCNSVSQDALDQSITAAEQRAGIHMVGLLEKRQYAVIESTLRSAVAAYKEDCKNENKLGLLWEAFQRKNVGLESYFNEYVKTYPESYAAYMARGVYYITIAWMKRGTATINRTSKEQKEGLERYLRLAEHDLLKAKELSSNLPHVYAELITVMMPKSKNKARIEKIVEEGLTHHPNSVSIRLNYLQSLLPRWNGSLEEMEAVIVKTKPFVKNNPALQVVCGRVLVEKGDDYLFRREYSKAVQFYDEALQKGETAYLCGQKGLALLNNGQKTEAIKCFSRAIALRPSYSWAHKMVVSAAD